MIEHKEKAIELRTKIMAKVKMSFTDAKLLTIMMSEEIRKNTLMPKFWDEVIKEAKKL
jgi:hypothetical protein